MKKLINYIVFMVLILAASSCNDFLDVMPDKRAELDSDEKLRQLLVSAYSIVDPMMIYEHRTDNAMDNGTQYGSPLLMLSENYQWKDISSSGWDEPENLWEDLYMAIATANEVLAKLEELGETDFNRGIKAEALMCRAYGHFLLANTFCKPYNTATASTDLGIPYVEEAETYIGKVYERGTVAEVYEKISQDIEEAYPLINNNNYDIPLYHFNKRASAAFAARFYLFYGKYELALEYANDAIPENPSSVLRDLKSYQSLASSSEWTYAFIDKDEPSNLMLIALRSLWGRNYYSARYGNSDELTWTNTFRSAGPWGPYLADFDYLFGGSSYPVKYQPKYGEIFEITNQTARTGQPHVVQMAFTTDETLMVRAEAKVMLKQYNEAAQDLSYWYVKKGGSAASAQEIVNFYTQKQAVEQEDLENGQLDPWLVLVKPFNANFDIEEGTQEMMLQGVLHARRIETMYSGLRWLDIRRYGIEVVHNISGGNPITLTHDDPRKVIQIPQAVISAGLEANPQ